MGLTNLILDKLTTKRGADTASAAGKYCLFLSGFKEILEKVIIMEVDIKQESKILTTPTESGSIISDHRIFQPMEITVKCALPIEDWNESYEEMLSWYNQTEADFVTIITKADSYSNMQLISIPHQETADSVSRLFFDLKFREVKIVSPLYIDMPVETVESKQNAKTVDAGEKPLASKAANLFGLG